MTTSLSKGAQPTGEECEVHGGRHAVNRIFQQGLEGRFRTWRYVDYIRPVNRGFLCTRGGFTFGTKTVMERKPREVQVRQEVVDEIKRLKRLGYIMFEGDKRWV